jgi:hypothetical protein
LASNERWTVRRSTPVLVGLALLGIASVVRGQFRQADERPDPSHALDSRVPVPAPVMSTLRRACFDCHSQETRWPWYARIPVTGWLIERDVKAARGQLNFSQWTQYNSFDRAELLDKVCELATSGAMPLPRYLMLHRDARLSQADVARLCEWSRVEATRLVQGGS